MATMAADPTFVDTNVLVYATEPRSKFHEAATNCLDVARAQSRPLRISRQILREYLATVTRPQLGVPPLGMTQALADVERFERAFEFAEDGRDVFLKLRFLLRDIPVGGKQVHDANIVATMLAHGLARLATFNTADFRRFGEHIEVVFP